MRGENTKQASMLCLISPESVVPKDHPIRLIKALADAVLEELSPVFDGMYSSVGRPSIPPERQLNRRRHQVLRHPASEANPR